MFIFLPHFEHPEIMRLLLTSSFSLILLVCGLVGMMFFRTHNPFDKKQVDRKLDAGETQMILVFTALDLVLISIINYVTFQASPLFQSFANFPDPRMQFLIFSILIGWTEEVFFRGFMLTWLARFSGIFFSVITSTFAWWLFHGGVYGLELEPLIIIMVCGFVLSVSFIASNFRLSVPMTPHGINNFLGFVTRGSVLGDASTSVVLTLIRMVFK
jgi:membrane protease YdiL (CAAX protease family)